MRSPQNTRRNCWHWRQHPSIRFFACHSRCQDGLCAGRISGFFVQQSPFIAVVAFLLILVTGCEEPPPPPAPEPPPPPPPASPRELAEKLRPFWFYLHERAFLPSWDTAARGPYIPRVQKDGEERITAAKATSPTSLTDQQSALAQTPEASTLFAHANAPNLFWMSPTDRGYSGPQTRLLKIYRLQALDDMQNENYHRANVLYRSVRANFTPLDSDQLLSELTKFFDAPPEPIGYENTANSLADYVQEKATRMVLQGEHAAVLFSALQDDAGKFLLDELSTQLNLITIPLVRSIRRYGESYALRTPASLPTTETHLNALFNALQAKNNLRTWDTDFFALANQPKQRDPEYAANIRTLAALIDADAQRNEAAQPPRNQRAPEAATKSVATIMPELWSQQRSIRDWIREKKLLLPLPWYVTSGKIDLPPELLKNLCPLSYNLSVDKVTPYKLSNDLFLQTQLSDEMATVMEAWCQSPTDPFPLDPQGKAPVHDDGTAHFLLGWYFLEHGEPAMARRTWLIGSSALTTAADQADATGLNIADQQSQSKILLQRINSLRLILAAASIRDAPPGAQTSSATYLSELRVLLAAWRARWLRAGFRDIDCINAIDALVDIIRDVQDRNTQLDREPERYFFPDYLFEYGDVPDTLVAAALDDNSIVSSGNKFLEITEKLTAIPQTFTEDIIQRWTIIAAEEGPALE